MLIARWYKASWLSTDAVAFDVCAVADTWLAAYAIRSNGAVPIDFACDALYALRWVFPVYAVCSGSIAACGASLPDQMRITKAVTGGTLIVMIGAVVSQPMLVIPRSVLMGAPLLLFLDGWRSRDQTVLSVRRFDRAG